MEKKHDENKRRIRHMMLGVIFMLLCTILISIGVRDFYIGFHNADLGYNIANCEDCIDTGSDGKIRDSYALYDTGTDMMIKSIFRIALGAFSYGVFIMDMLWSIGMLYSSRISGDDH